MRIYYIFISNRTQQAVLFIKLVSYLVTLKDQCIIWTIVAILQYISEITTILCHRNQYSPSHQPALEHLS